jgi:diguanylate cyclase (GGDEF)-like protein/PAS domain S-box-containing protein
MLDPQNPEIFRIVLDSLPTAVCLLAKDFRITLWNQGAEQITGYMRHEVVGRLLAETILVYCNGLQCVICGNKCLLAAAVNDGKPREARVPLRHKHGHEVPVRMQLTPIRDEHGSLLVVAVTFNSAKPSGNRDRRQENMAASGCVDDTTEIPNHSFTQFNLEENLSSFTQYHLPFGIMLFRVDHFEQFRASYGKEAGHAILHVVAQTLRNALRYSDFLGRYDEDQFLAILVSCTNREVEDAGNRFRRLIGRTELRWWGDLLTVTNSVGWASVQSGDTINSLLERARQSSSQPEDKSTKAAGAGSE